MRRSIIQFCLAHHHQNYRTTELCTKCDFSKYFDFSSFSLAQTLSEIMFRGDTYKPERKKRVSEEFTAKFYKIEPAKKIQKLLDEKPAKLSISTRVVTQIRDFLLFRMMERNILLRPAALYHLPISEFEPGRGIWEPEKSRYE